MGKNKNKIQNEERITNKKITGIEKNTQIEIMRVGGQF